MGIHWLASLLPPLLTVCCTLALTRLLSRPRGRMAVLDRPGPRSLHEVPTPRTGGWGVWGGVILGWGLARLLGLPVATDPWLLGGWALIAGVSLLDDLRGLPPLPRFIVHFLAAALLLPAGLTLQALHLPGGVALPLAAAGVPLTLVLVAWLANLYNFMDGMDGFAGGMGAIGFGALALLGGLKGHPGLMHTAALIALANAAFLAFNFPPASIFMGDTGSVPMGFAAAALSLWGVSAGLFAFWVPALIFSPFIVDATVTLISRAARREKVWQAHRSHYYQRLVLMGWGHRNTVLAEYALMLAAGACAVWVSLAATAALQIAMVAAWVVVYILIALAVRHAERRRPNQPG